MHRITLLGTGFIGNFYTMTLNGRRSSDRVHAVYGRNEDHARQFAEQWHLPHSTADMAEAINHPETDVVVIGLPNHLHEDAVRMTAEAGKAVLCTKPLGRTAEEARRMLQAVEKAGVFAGYLEDLVYTPKTLKSLAAVRDGALGQVLWVRSRETHPGPHSPWFLDPELAGGGAIIDMGCHCVEIIRSFIGKRNRPVEVMCWADTLVHPIDAEDHGIGLVRFESGAVGQFEVSWAFRGGMDLRDEVSGTEGTIRMDHFLRTGFEVFSAGGRGGYVAEKAEQETGWLFPVGDEAAELGYVDMFRDMFNAIDEGREPTETFYDGYVVNAIVDASYRSAKSKLWEPIELKGWRGAKKTEKITAPFAEVDGQVLIKKERLPDGRTRMILKNKKTGRVSEKMVE
jgi:predicted dehydrogenase